MLVSTINIRHFHRLSLAHTWCFALDLTLCLCTAQESIHIPEPVISMAMKPANKVSAAFWSIPLMHALINQNPQHISAHPLCHPVPLERHGQILQRHQPLHQRRPHFQGALRHREQGNHNLRHGRVALGDLLPGMALHPRNKPESACLVCLSFLWIYFF